MAVNAARHDCAMLEQHEKMRHILGSQHVEKAQLDENPKQLILPRLLCRRKAQAGGRGVRI